MSHMFHIKLNTNSWLLSWWVELGMSMSWYNGVSWEACKLLHWVELGEEKVRYDHLCWPHQY